MLGRKKELKIETGKLINYKVAAPLQARNVPSSSEDSEKGIDKRDATEAKFTTVTDMMETKEMREE